MNIIIALLKGSVPPASAGVIVGTTLNVIGSDNVAQKFTLNGTESPPWTQAVTVQAGAVSAVATDVDVNGNAIGSPISQTYTLSSGGGTPPAAGLAATTGMTITPAP